MIRTTITNEELEEKYLSWTPELIFAASNGLELLMCVDIFNEHIMWDVRWIDYADKLAHYKEFDNFIDAKEYFLKQLRESDEAR